MYSFQQAFRYAEKISATGVVETCSSVPLLASNAAALFPSPRGREPAAKEIRRCIGGYPSPGRKKLFKI